MKITNKLIITASLILQIAGSLYADNWSDAILEFYQAATNNVAPDLPTAAQFIVNAGSSIPLPTSQDIVKQLGTPESKAVAIYVTLGNPVTLVKYFPQAAPMQSLQDAINSILAQTFAVATPAPVAPVATPTKTGGWWGGNTSAPSLSAADVQKAVNAQKSVDMALATANNQALLDIVNSGKSGIGLYTQFIDYMFSVLQVAINAIADTGTQQQILSYTQSKFAGMKASVAATNYQSRITGRYGSANKKSSSKKGMYKKSKSKNQAAA